MHAVSLSYKNQPLRGLGAGAEVRASPRLAILVNLFNGKVN